MKEAPQQEKPQLQPGDKVTYIVTRTLGTGFRMSEREGTLLKISGQFALIKSRGNEHWVETGNVRKAGQPNALTEAFKAAFKEEA
jgi:hypothetical protein